MRGFGGEGLGIRVESLGFRKVYCFQEGGLMALGCGGVGVPDLDAWGLHLGAWG